MTEPFDFRPFSADDFPLLLDWLARPHVARWWGTPPTADELREEFSPLLAPSSSVRPYIALHAGAPVGFVQSYVAAGSGDGWWPDETDPGVVGIDLFLAHADLLGRGLGTAMVRAFVDRLFRDPSVTRIQTDPAPDNDVAIRVYEKAGFRRVGEVRTPDGPAMLMIRDRDARDAI